MATNIKFNDGDQLKVHVGSGVESGDPVVFGNQPGVALTDADDDDYATVKFNGVATFELENANREDAVYITPATGALSLTDDANKVFYGVCLEDADADDMVDIRIGGIEPGSGS